MASPPASSPFFYRSSMETASIFSVTGAPATDDDDDIFISARRNTHPNQRLVPQQVAKTCSTGSEEQHSAEEDCEQHARSKHSRHECVLQMSRPWAVPRRRTSGFILDSRATSHVVADMSLFSPPSFRATKHNSPLTRRGSAAAAVYYQAHDGRVLAVVGVGTVSCGRFHIPNVRCVPDLCTGLNLISVQQLAECDYLVMFGGGQCSVMEQSSGKIVGRGLLHTDDGLYHLQFLDLSRDDKPCEEGS